MVIVCKGFATPPPSKSTPLSNISPFLKIIEPPILRGNFVVTGRQEMEIFLNWTLLDGLNHYLDMYLVSNLVFFTFGKHENG